MDEVRAELPELFEFSVAVKDSTNILFGMVSGDSEIVCHDKCLLCGLGRDFFELSVGVRQPNFMDVREHVVARLCICVAIALQYFMTFERIFHRHERHVRSFSWTDEEDERFFSYKALVIVDSAHAVMQHFSFADQVGRGVSDDADESAAFVVLQGQIFFRNGGKLFVKRLFRFSVRFCACRGVLVDADVVPTLEVVWKTVLVLCHIQPEMIAGFEIVEIGVRVGSFCRDIIEEPFKFLAAEEFFDKGKACVMYELELRLFAGL